MDAKQVKSEPSIEAAEDALETSRMDARVLLWFATREGKKVGEKVLKDVVGAESDLRDKKQPFPSIEASFWTAYRDLAAAVKPASVESILSTCRHPFGKHGPTGKWKLANARKTKAAYTAAAVSVLIALLLVQTYWFVITASSANLEKHRNELDGIAGGLRLMNVLAEQMSQQYLLDLEHEKQKTSLTDVANVYEQGQDTSTREVPARHEWRDNTQVKDLIKTDIQTLLENKPTLAAIVLSRDPELQLTSMGFLDLENKKYRKLRLIAMLNNEMAVLQQPWKMLLYLFQDRGNDGNQNNERNWDASNDRNLIDPPQWELADGKKIAEFHSEILKEQRDINMIITNDGLEHVLSRSKSIPTILSQYFLPILYGLLGSLTYILRNLSTQIQDVTFTRASASQYSLRWPLGMLAGVTIGVFFDPAGLTGLAAITPLGIAFLAGYGVELFFTALDGLVRTFARNDPERPRAEAT